MKAQINYFLKLSWNSLDLCMRSSFPIWKPEYFFIPSTEHTKAHVINKHLYHFKNSILKDKFTMLQCMAIKTAQLHITVAYIYRLCLQIHIKYLNILQYIFVYDGLS